MDRSLTTPAPITTANSTAGTKSTRFYHASPVVAPFPEDIARGFDGFFNAVGTWLVTQLKDFSGTAWTCFRSVLRLRI